MFFCTNETYATVWKVSKSDKYLDLQISTSEKDSNGERVYSSWFPRAIGQAMNSLKDVKKGDKIIIKRAKIAMPQYTDKEGNVKSRLNVLILDASLQEEANVQMPKDKVEEKQEDDNPWA